MDILGYLIGSAVTLIALVIGWGMGSASKKN